MACTYCCRQSTCRRKIFLFPAFSSSSPFLPYFLSGSSLHFITPHHIFSSLFPLLSPPFSLFDLFPLLLSFPHLLFNSFLLFHFPSPHFLPPPLLSFLVISSYFLFSPLHFTSVPFFPFLYVYVYVSSPRLSSPLSSLFSFAFLRVSCTLTASPLLFSTNIFWIKSGFHLMSFQLSDLHLFLSPFPFVFAVTLYYLFSVFCVTLCM